MGVQGKAAAKPLRYEAGSGRCGRSVRLGAELQGGAAERRARSDDPTGEHGRPRPRTLGAGRPAGAAAVSRVHRGQGVRARRYQGLTLSH